MVAFAIFANAPTKFTYLELVIGFKYRVLGNYCIRIQDLVLAAVYKPHASSTPFSLKRAVTLVVANGGVVTWQYCNRITIV